MTGSIEIKYEKLQKLDIGNILLDPLNPRLGAAATEGTLQEEIVSKIITDFGIDDLLSSMAFNGYFEAEPIVCQIRKGKYYVIEGNRRLVASLILTGDKRADRHVKDFTYYRKLYKEKNSPNLNELPVVIFEENTSPQRISAYLGIRHIVSTKDWDSFAKARWINQTIRNTGLSIADISQMTGDKSNTIKNLLSGYNLMSQLETAKKFNSENTVRKGRGSNVSYPFSWVYTLFSYSIARDFLNVIFFQDDGQPNPNPIPQDRLDDASFIIDAMFGNSAKGRNSILNDSREITKFAEALGDPVKVQHLKEGKTLQEVTDITTDIKTRLEDIFFKCITLLKDGDARITLDADNITDMIIQNSLERIQDTNRLLKSMRDKLIATRNENEDTFDIEIKGKNV